MTKLEAIKIIFPYVLAIFLFIAAVFGVILPAQKAGLMDSRKDMLRELTVTAHTILSFYEGQEKAGILSRKAAQGAAISRLLAA